MVVVVIVDVVVVVIVDVVVVVIVDMSPRSDRGRSLRKYPFLFMAYKDF